MKTLAERVCLTLEGITLLDMDESPLGSMVYKFCHIASGRCKNPHTDWMEEFEEMEAAINRACASPKAKRWIERQQNENKTRVREQQ